MLVGELVSPFHRGRGGPGGWWILFEPEIHLHDGVVVPDLAGWRPERRPQVPRATAISLAPDRVCEVASPATARLDRAVKMEVHAREGVGGCWIVEPDPRMLECFRLHEGRWLRVAAHAGHEVVRVEPFEAVEIALAALWGEEATLGAG